MLDVPLQFLRLKRSYFLKVVSNIFELSSYSTYPEFDLSRVHSVHNAYKIKGSEKMFEMGGVQINR